MLEHSPTPVILLLSTYELGRQPFGLASPIAWLREAGFEVRAADLSRERLSRVPVGEAALVAFFLPMHTATRLALPVIDRVRVLNPRAHLAAYGVYAPLAADRLRAHGVQTILAGEFEEALVRLARSISTGSVDDRHAEPLHAPTGPPRLAFKVPERDSLLPLDRYAALQMPDGTRRAVGYTEASRGCKHLCRHCPIVPVYNGHFRIVPIEVTLADVAAQVAAGAQHVTFGDPDFFNGPTHAQRLVEQFHRRFPGVSYDVTIKIEHLLRHRDLIPTLRDTGCAFVTSAVESVDDDVLDVLRKGHTRADVERAVRLMQEHRVPLSPTFVAFTPWTTLASYADLLDTIAALGLVGSVASIQLAIRLLLPAGSPLLQVRDVAALAGPLDATALVHRWQHPDRRVDDLQRELQQLVGRSLTASRHDVFAAAHDLARHAAGRPLPRPEPPRPARVTVPYLTEPWYC